jgi:hypothetical protein
VLRDVTARSQPGDAGRLIAAHHKLDEIERIASGAVAVAVPLIFCGIDEQTAVVRKVFLGRS